MQESCKGNKITVAYVPGKLSHPRIRNAPSNCSCKRASSACLLVMLPWNQLRINQWIFDLFIYLVLKTGQFFAGTLQGNTYCGPITVPSLWKIDDHTRKYIPCSLQTVCGFFNIPQNYIYVYAKTKKGCETGPLVYCLLWED